MATLCGEGAHTLTQPLIWSGPWQVLWGRLLQKCSAESASVVELMGSDTTKDEDALAGRPAEECGPRPIRSCMTDPTRSWWPRRQPFDPGPRRRRSSASSHRPAPEDRDSSPKPKATEARPTSSR